MNEEQNEQLTNTRSNMEQGINKNTNNAFNLSGNQENIASTENMMANANSTEIASNQNTSTQTLGQSVFNSSVINNGHSNGINTANNLQAQNDSLNQGISTNNIASVTNQETTQQTLTAPSNNDFSGVIDPSKITVGPEAIHPQIPVDNLPQQNLSVDNENKNVEPKKNNTFSLILVFILFVGVGAFIWFMPEIRQMLNDKKTTEQSQPSVQPEENEEKQTNHYDSMICSQITNTYTIYSQEDKVKKYSTSTEYTKEIEANYQSCLTLQQSEVNGFVVGCDKTTNSVTVVKTYDFSILPDTFTMDTLDFRKDDSVKSIKANLQKKGYTCS